MWYKNLLYCTIPRFFLETDAHMMQLFTKIGLKTAYSKTPSVVNIVMFLPLRVVEQSFHAVCLWIRFFVAFFLNISILYRN